MPRRPAKRSLKGPAKRRTATAKSQPKADRPFAPGYGIVGAEEGKGLLPWAWVARKMNSCRTVWLATIHAGHGRPHVMPVWGVWLDDAFFFSTGRKSRKGQNLSANPACTIANDDGEEGLAVEGLATQAEDAAAGARRDRLQEEIQDGPAEHGRTDLPRPAQTGLRFRGKSLSAVRNSMETMRHRSRTPGW